MKRILLLVLMLLAAPAMAQNSPFYWQGQTAKLFPTTGVFLDKQRSVRFGDSGSTNYVELKAGSSVTTYTITLPLLVGSTGSLLYASNGSGTTAWTASDVTTTHVLHAGSPPAFGAIASGDLPAASSSQSGSVSYEDSGTFTATFTGPFNSGSQTIQYVRVGKMVTIMLPSITGTCTSATVMTATSAVPAGLQPVALTATAVGVANNGSQLTSPLGVLQITTGGTITIYRDNNGSTFSNASNTCGLQPGQSSPYTLITYIHS